jgi:ribosomal protein S18 acetylase RimI-like enzyme
MFRFRVVDINKDRDILLEFHSRINYESDTPFARTVSYEKYREKWLNTSQPESYLSELAKTMRDSRTIAEILEDNGVAVGYSWVAFRDIEGYNITIAELMDIAVAPEHQRHGIGLMMMEHIEKIAKKQGATLLRSCIGIENIASQKLHEKFGFKPYRIYYEKVLS